jgi:hypothetical protein
MGDPWGPRKVAAAVSSPSLRLEKKGKRIRHQLDERKRFRLKYFSVSRTVDEINVVYIDNFNRRNSAIVNARVERKRAWESSLREESLSFKEFLDISNRRRDKRYCLYG